MFKYRYKVDNTESYTILRFGMPFLLKFSRRHQEIYQALKNAKFKFNFKHKFKMGKEYGSLIIDGRQLQNVKDLKSLVSLTLKDFNASYLLREDKVDIIVMCHPKIREQWSDVSQLETIPAFTPIYLQRDIEQYLQECADSTMKDFSLIGAIL